MQYEYIINNENKTINVLTIGNLEAGELAAMGLEIMMKAKELKYKIIFDFRLSKNKVSIGEAYFWFSMHYDKIDIEFRHIPTVYIVNKDDWDFYSFFECTCINRGIPIKVFLDENGVLKWLERI